MFRSRHKISFLIRGKRIYHFFTILVLILTSIIAAQNININSSNDWQFLGLENEGITAIAVDWSDPSIIYAGSGSDFSSGTVGGIFKSIDGGVTWDTIIRGVTVRDIDIHPSNQRILYATLELNVLTQPGIIKTTDAGATWFSADNGIYITWEEGPGLLEINPKYPDTLYAGTGGFFGGKPYKSTNGGENWFRIDPNTLWTWAYRLCGDSIFMNGYPLRDGITAIAIDPNNTNIIYAGTAYNGDLYKSTDGGINWIMTCLPRVGIVNEIELNPNSSEIIYCGTWGYGFFVSTNGGFSWESFNTGLPDTSQVENIELNYFQNNLIFFIIANFRDSGGVYQRTNNGSWERIGINEGRVGTIKLFNEKLYAGQSGIYVNKISVNVDEDFQKLLTFVLYQNYPNPFNSNTDIKYEINGEENISIEIYDILGREIAILVNEEKSDGIYSVNFNATNLSSGIYFYSISAGNFHQTKKMILLR